ncbi:NTP transferase domain-containing protein [Bacillus sp. S/N-304-OC-R1]|uniref:nucleotidyltransferase family protein n=1 Tax=Bacillus sp. S/N-304-OC-R1 TaxID=2758034 RepID=UPI001C8E8439|nr:nucleotidyltransferase family protein [Bacillus sp. S/N-304-OC-R1]MBY0120505.1 nucleotidyltransferase family protein [Bacillus sp. S/N-304-OC-R1]
MSVSAVLLSAGKSTRMHPLPHKGLVNWQGTTLFQYQIQSLLNSAVSEIIVVLGYQAKFFLPLASKYPVKTIYNENYENGKCSSIIKGLQSIDHTSKYILMTAVDQPTAPSINNELINSLKTSNASIAIPACNGKRGHPILFSSKLFNELLLIQEETFGLRNIIRKYEKEILELPVDTPLISLNINTPENYQDALNTYY